MASGVAPWVLNAVGGVPVGHTLTLEKVADERVLGRGGFALTSAAFQNGGELDPSFTAIEEDAVAPPLEWTSPPPGAQEIVLGKLMEGETPPRTGKNAHGNSEWLLPDPPLGEEHRYVFQLFAIDLPLTLMPGATHEELVRNLDGHVTAAAVLTARFEGHEVEELDVEDLGDVD